jgi:hypothetical protein
LEPRFRLGFGDDGEDFDGRFCDVIEHPYLINPQSVLRLTEAFEPLDAASADFRGLVSQMALQRISHLTPDVSGKLSHRIDSAGRQDDVVAHSG